MAKQEKEFFDPKDIIWRACKGYPPGIYEQILSEDKKAHTWTRIVKWCAGVDTHET